MSSWPAVLFCAAWLASHAIASCASAAEPGTRQSDSRAVGESSKTYRHARFGFSFDYPASWAVIEDAEPSASALATIRLLNPDENVPIARERSPGSFAIHIFPNPKRLAVRDWLDEHGWPFGAERSVAATSVAGVPSLEVATPKMFAPNRFIFVAVDEHVLRLSPTARESESIVKSFRFSR